MQLLSGDERGETSAVRRLDRALPHSYIVVSHSKSRLASHADFLRLPPPQRPLCIVGREKESARGTMGGEGRRSLFPLPIVPRTLSMFRLHVLY